MKKLFSILAVLLPLTLFAEGRCIQDEISNRRLGIDTTIVLYVGRGTMSNSVVVDDGYYNGFPFPIYLSQNTVVSYYKKADNHVDAGPFTRAITTDGGITWSEQQIKVGGVPLTTAALSVCRLASGRIVIGYQDDTYTTLHFAYSDDGINFTASASVITGTYTISFSPIKMFLMPSGKIMCGYYDLGTTAKVGFIQSTDNGVTWSVGATIFVHGGTGFGDDKGAEFGCAIIVNTGTDATCQLIALVRDLDQGGAYMHYYSNDGGATWNTSFTVDNPGAYSRHYFYPFGGYTSQAPCDIIVHNGLVYVLTGYRNSQIGQQFALEYVTASPTDAYTNNFHNWSSVSVVLNAAQNDVNFGYPLMFVDGDGKLWCHYYDVSPLPNNGLGTPRVRILQQLIAN